MKVKIIKADFAEELERNVNKWLEKEPRGVDRSIRKTTYLNTMIGLLAIIEYCDIPLSFAVAREISKEQNNE